MPLLWLNLELVEVAPEMHLPSPYSPCTFLNCTLALELALELGLGPLGHARNAGVPRIPRIQLPLVRIRSCNHAIRSCNQMPRPIRCYAAAMAVRRATAMALCDVMQDTDMRDACMAIETGAGAGFD